MIFVGYKVDGENFYLEKNEFKILLRKVIYMPIERLLIF